MLITHLKIKLFFLNEKIQKTSLVLLLGNKCKAVTEDSAKAETCYYLNQCFSNLLCRVPPQKVSPS